MKNCAICGRAFAPTPNHPHQTLCSAYKCKQARRKQLRDQEKAKVTRLCTICGSGIPTESHGRRVTCGDPVCVRKHRSNGSISSRERSRIDDEFTEEELRAACHEFYAHCQPIKWGKKEAKKCPVCHRVSLVTNGYRICHSCRSRQPKYGVLANHLRS